MEVNLKPTQDAVAVPYSGLGGQGSVAVASAPESVTPVAAGEPKQASDAVSSLGQSKQKELNKEELQKVAADMTEVMQSLNTDIQFSVHEKTGRLIVRVVDDKTQQVLKEIPSKEMLDTIAAIRDYVGALLDKKA